jgi:hypothetical protein
MSISVGRAPFLVCYRLPRYTDYSFSTATSKSPGYVPIASKVQTAPEVNESACEATFRLRSTPEVIGVFLMNSPTSWSLTGPRLAMAEEGEDIGQGIGLTVNYNGQS